MSSADMPPASPSDRFSALLGGSRGLPPGSLFLGDVDERRRLDAMWRGGHFDDAMVLLNENAARARGKEWSWSGNGGASDAVRAIATKAAADVLQARNDDVAALVCALKLGEALGYPRSREVIPSVLLEGRIERRTVTSAKEGLTELIRASAMTATAVKAVCEKHLWDGVLASIRSLVVEHRDRLADANGLPKLQRAFNYDEVFSVAAERWKDAYVAGNDVDACEEVARTAMARRANELAA